VNPSSTARPSVIAAAVASFVISLVSILTAMFFSLGVAITPRQNSGRPFQAVALDALIVLIVLWVMTSVFGVVLGVGLLRRLNWARILAMVWAGVMILCSLPFFAMAARTFLPQTGASTSGAMLTVTSLMIGVSSLAVGIWWLILFTRKSIVAEFESVVMGIPLSADAIGSPETSPAPLSTDSLPVDPFSRLKARLVLGGCGLALVVTIFLLVFALIFLRIGLGRMPDMGSPMVFPVLGVLFYGLQLLLILYLLRRAPLRPAVLFGESMRWNLFRGYRSLPVLLFGASMAGYFLLFFPLSYAMPRWIDRYLFQQRTPEMFHTSGTAYHVGDVLMMLVIVFLGPIVEELIFRGVLLTRWTLKWSVRKSMLLTSILFGLLHREVIGHVFFGYVMAVLYIETKSLYVPIAMHIANNGIAWILNAVFVVWGHGTKSTLGSFQSSWRFNLTLTLIVVPWAVWFVSRHRPTSNWKMPYSDFREQQMASKATLESIHSSPPEREPAPDVVG
jgi:membrane protease YdiL (CAAX protease family)